MRPRAEDLLIGTPSMRPPPREPQLGPPGYPLLDTPSGDPYRGPLQWTPERDPPVPHFSGPYSWETLQLSPKGTPSIAPFMGPHPGKPLQGASLEDKSIGLPFRDPSMGSPPANHHGTQGTTCWGTHELNPYRGHPPGNTHHRTHQGKPSMRLTTGDRRRTPHGPPPEDPSRGSPPVYSFLGNPLGDPRLEDT